MLMKSRYYNAAVKKFVPHGVQLDLGVEKPGYLHVSRMKPKGEFVSNSSEVLTEGCYPSSRLENQGT